MRNRLILLPVGAILLMFLVDLQIKGGQSGGDWIPIIAKQKETVCQDLPGRGRVLVRDAVGSYLRDRHGSVYERTIAVQEEAPRMPDSATLDVVREGKVYMIDYGAKSVRILKEDRPLLQPRTSEESRAGLSRMRSLGTKMIGTIRCEGYAANPGRGEKESRGEVWVAPSIDFLMVQNLILDRSFKNCLPNTPDVMSAVVK